MELDISIRTNMTKENKEKLQEKIIESMCEISVKAILETYEEIDNLYENGEITSDDFYAVVEELKMKMES